MRSFRKTNECNNHLGCCEAQIVEFGELRPQFCYCNGFRPMFCISGVTYGHIINIEDIVKKNDPSEIELSNLRCVLGLKDSLQLCAQSS